METTIDFYQHVSLQFNTLKFFGLWYYIPYSKTSIWFWAGIFHRVVIGILIFILSTGGQIVYLVRFVMSGNSNIVEVTGMNIYIAGSTKGAMDNSRGKSNDKTNSLTNAVFILAQSIFYSLLPDQLVINLIITEVMSELKFLDMRLRRDSLSKLIDQLHNEDFQCRSQPEKDICQKAIKLSRRMFIIILFCSYVDVFVHDIIVPALEKFEIPPLKMDFIFFDVNDPKYFKFVCAYQILYKPCIVAIYLAHQCMPWAAMSFTISQLDVLIYNFENMKELVKSAKAERNCSENEAFRQTFRRLVLHHSSIIRFINILQATFGGQLSIYLFMSASIIGTTALRFFSIESLLNNFSDIFWLLMFMNLFIWILFIDCYFGNSITVKCEQLSMCVYSCSWMDLDKSLKKSVILFMTKTQQPVVITAAKLFPVSLATFTRVMNWTYKGFAVMNHMK